MDLLDLQSLLQEVFPNSERYRNLEYLAWQYEQCPSGRVVSADCHDGAGITGHYALVPQRWLREGTPAVFALSLNTAVAARARGRGVFTDLASEAYQLAAEQGVDTIIGVANANSTPGFVRRLGFDRIGSLPVIAAPNLPARTRAVQLDLDEVRADSILATQVDHTDTRRRWDKDELHWRLRDPNQRFVIIRLEDALVIACLARVHRIRFAIIAKVFARPLDGPVRARAVVGSVCWALRVPFAVYAGFNPHFEPTGVPVPIRFRPSPLNLIVRSLVSEPTSTDLRPDCYEFLDFDAY